MLKNGKLLKRKGDIMKEKWIGCLFIFFIGCTDGKEQVLEKFLQHEVLDIPDMLIGSPVDIQKEGDCLIVMDYKQDSLFHRVDLSKKIYMGMFGEKGNGPGEFIYPASLKGWGNGSFSCYDVSMRELSLISLGAESEKVEVSRLYRNDNFMTFDIVPLSDSLYIVCGETEGAMFSLINREGDVLSVSDEYPYKDEEEKKIPVRFRAMAYQGTLRVNPNGNFAYATLNAKQVHLYKVENELIRKVGEVIDGYSHYQPNMQREGSYGVAHDGKSPKCYMDLAVSEKYVYALYSGRSFEEYRMSAYEGETVLVYDWTGDLVKTYRLDIPINQFCIDENERIMYATANIPDPTIVCFQLD